jgi:hypothetical protein
VLCQQQDPEVFLSLSLSIAVVLSNTGTHPRYTRTPHTTCVLLDLQLHTDSNCVLPEITWTIHGSIDDGLVIITLWLHAREAADNYYGKTQVGKSRVEQGSNARPVASAPGAHTNRVTARSPRHLKLGYRLRTLVQKCFLHTPPLYNRDG